MPKLSRKCYMASLKIMIDTCARFASFEVSSKLICLERGTPLLPMLLLVTFGWIVDYHMVSRYNNMTSLVMIEVACKESKKSLDLCELLPRSSMCPNSKNVIPMNVSFSVCWISEQYWMLEMLMIDLSDLSEKRLGKIDFTVENTC